MIPKKTIQTFLTRPRDDLRRYKTFSEQQLDEMAAELPVAPPLWDRLRLPQKACFLLGVKYRRLGLWLDTGIGKTVLSIALARYFRRAKIAKRFLVLVPNKVNREEWVREIEKHSPGTSHVVLTGSSTNKWLQLEENLNTTLAIATYAAVVRMVSDLEEDKKRNKDRLQIIPKKMKALIRRFDGLIYDESTAAASPKRSVMQRRVCRQLASHLPILFELSGTPFGNDPTPLWGQMYMIDGGESLGRTLGLFRAAFFTEKAGYFGGIKYKFRADMKPELSRLLAHRSIRYKADAASLPRKVFIVKEIKLPQDAVAYYNEAKNQLIHAHGNYQEMKNSFVRMRQISSGFLGYTDDETGTRAQIEFKPNGKLELLMSLIESVIDEHKVVVFNEYTFSGSVIGRELERQKIGYARVFGKSKDPGAELRRFVGDDNCRVFIVQNEMTYGLNLQCARYGVFYESPVRPILRTQAERRVERQGSQHESVFIYDLVVRGTVDADILEALAAGRDLFETVMDQKQKGSQSAPLARSTLSGVRSSAKRSI